MPIYSAAQVLPPVCLIAVNGGLFYVDIAGAKRKLMTQKLNGSLSPQLEKEQTVVYQRMLDRTFRPIFGKVSLFTSCLPPHTLLGWMTGSLSNQRIELPQVAALIA